MPLRRCETGRDEVSKIIVSHASYGCDTGCCGHVIEVDGERVGSFRFDHPYRADFRKWAEELIADELGPEHVKDLDWENCVVLDD